MTVIVILAGVLLPLRPAAAADAVRAEADFVSAINALRLSKGLPELTVHPELVDIARAWAAKMAAVDRISHNGEFSHQVAADWEKLGENVGVGMTVAKLHAAFVASPS